MSDFNYTEYLKDNPLLKIDPDNTLITERKKEGYDDREDESVSARKGKEANKKQSFKDRRDDSYGKMGKRDAEKKGKNKINKESVSETAGKYYSVELLVPEVAFNVDTGELADSPYAFATEDEIKNGEADVTTYTEGDELDEWVFGRSYDQALHFAKEYPNLIKINTNSSVREREGFEEDDIKTEEMSSKMKKSELKAKIRETILSELSEESQYNASIYSEAEEDVDVDVDVEDEVNVDVEPDEIDIEKKAVKTTVNVGLTPEEEVIQDSLKAAMDSANALGNDKLADQIGNTITFFTREYVVNRNDD